MEKGSRKVSRNTSKPVKDTESLTAFKKRIKTSSRLKRLRLNYDSWFDLWHTHNDWWGNASDSRIRRRFQLQQLLQMHNALKIKLSHRTDEIQLFIWIHEKASGSDAVYLHSRNPNSEKFPHKPKVEKWLDNPPLILLGIIDPLLYRIGCSDFPYDGRSYFIERKKSESR